MGLTRQAHLEERAPKLVDERVGLCTTGLRPGHWRQKVPGACQAIGACTGSLLSCTERSSSSVPVARLLRSTALMDMRQHVAG